MAALLNATELTNDYLSPAVMEEAFGRYRHAAGCVAHDTGCAYHPAHLAHLGPHVAVVLMVLDLVIARNTKARWMALHTLANAMVCLFSWSEVSRAAEDPLHSCSGPAPTYVPAYIICAVHFYHLVGGFKLTADDWIHHCVFVTYIGYACFAFEESGPLVNLIAFFMCGLPGGLDYIMLVLVKHNVISSHTEKVWNSRINVWLRSPGLLLAAYCMFVASRSGPRHTPCAQHPIKTAINAMLVFSNAQSRPSTVEDGRLKQPCAPRAATAAVQEGRDRQPADRVGPGHRRAPASFTFMTAVMTDWQSPRWCA
eukprot:scaffold23755_cov163-Isochrysis_galbana.AAC.3